MTHLAGDSSELRARGSTAVTTAKPNVVSGSVGSGKFADVDPIAILKTGVRTVRHHKLGWLREDLIANGSIDGTAHTTKTNQFLLDPEYAATHFTPRFFYLKEQMKKWLRTNPQATAQRKAVARKRWRAEWEKQKAMTQDLVQFTKRRPVIMKLVKLVRRMN